MPESHPGPRAASDSRREILAFHGWGFDRTCWDPWRPLLRDGTSLATYERGYFGTAAGEVDWSPNTRAIRILFAHSMGLMFCGRPLLERAHIVVLFGCFEHFHPASGEGREPSRTALADLKTRMERNPGATLRAFYRECGLPGGVRPPAAPSVDRLKEDLTWLDTGCVDPTALANVPVVHLFHGTRDRVVPLERGESLLRSLGPNASLQRVSGAGHALPITHPDRCWEAVRSDLDAQPERHA